MSYKSFKRMLGETNLERKCRFLFGACLSLLIFGSFLLYGRQTKKLVYEKNPEQGRLLVDSAMLLHHWENIKRLSAAHDMEKELARDSSRSLQAEKYTWNVLRQDAAPGTSSAVRPPQDDFEREVLEYFRQRRPVEAATDAGAPPARPEYRERFLTDKAEYQYFQPVYATSQNCVLCHNGLGDVNLGGQTATRRPLVEGDLMGVVKIAMSDKPTQRALEWNRAILIATGVFTVFLAMIAAYIIVRYVIVKPLKHLTDVSDQIRAGNTELRAEIKTGDEFEQLAVAFNRMLRHLVATQEELRHVNANLDGKVDELAQANMQLFEMNRLKSDFLATMSHELRTPLNSIIGFSDVLSNIKSLDEKQQRYVQNIQKSGRMLLDMINDILDLAKIESGKMELRLSDFRIEHLVAAQCDMARPLAENKTINLETNIAVGLPPLRQDPVKVQQILNNLLSNAIKFTPEGGRIVVSAQRHSDGDLLLVVADTGVGIAADEQVAIFEKFRQGATALPGGGAMTREHSGTGLGLSIVKELCKLLGGEISLHSELGKGSTFTVRLPWALTEAPRTGDREAALDDLTKPRRSDFDSSHASPLHSAPAVG